MIYNQIVIIVAVVFVVIIIIIVIVIDIDIVAVISWDDPKKCTIDIHFPPLFVLILLFIATFLLSILLQ